MGRPAAAARGLLRLGQPVAEPAGDRDAAQRHARARQRAPARSPQHLKLEITESQVMTNPEHSAYMLQALQGAGPGPRARRFRHRPLVAELPPPLPVRHHQDPGALRADGRRHRHGPHPGADHPLDRRARDRTRPRRSSPRASRRSKRSSACSSSTATTPRASPSAPR